jgi:hypothetical protein
VFRSLPELIGRPLADPCRALIALDQASSSAAAGRYLDRLNTLAPQTADRVVDKMLDNVDLIGLIALLWPNARVIVCRRDVRDIAVSCWQTGFASIHWANDYEDIARRFADYQRIREYWRRTKPIAWLDVSYEELVRDVTVQSRRLIDFLGLASHRFVSPSILSPSVDGKTTSDCLNRCFRPWKPTESNGKRTLESLRPHVHRIIAYHQAARRNSSVVRAA